MTLPVILHPRAQRDLDRLEKYLSRRFSERNAIAYVQRLTEACHRIGTAPHLGTVRDDLHSGLRTTGFERRVTIAFQIREDHVLIAGLYYGGRQPR